MLEELKKQETSALVGAYYMTLAAAEMQILSESADAVSEKLQLLREAMVSKPQIELIEAFDTYIKIMIEEM